MRNQILELDLAFANLHHDLVNIAKYAVEDRLYGECGQKKTLVPAESCGVNIIRAAATIEQTFNGLTTRLWDNPFEWTLPEKLHSRELILEYLGEVEEIREKAFGFFRSDDDLKKELPAPVEMRSLESLLNETLEKARQYCSEAWRLGNSF